MSDPESQKRHLPLLPGKKEGEEPPSQTPWRGVVVATVVGIFAFVPLAMLAARITKAAISQVVPGDDALARAAAYRALGAADRLKIMAIMLFVPAVALALAAVVSGLLVGRFGSQEAKREGTIAGILLGLSVLAYSVLSKGLTGGILETIVSGTVILVLAALSGLVGAALGWRWRPDSDAGGANSARGAEP